MAKKKTTTKKAASKKTKSKETAVAVAEKLSPEEKIALLKSKVPSLCSASEIPARGVLRWGYADLDLIAPAKRGLVLVVGGPPQGGKSTLADRLIAQTQLRDDTHGHCLWIDAEGRKDKKWSEIQGVDMGRLSMINRQTEGAGLKPMESFLQEIDAAFDARVFDVVVLDSFQAMSPRREHMEQKGKTKIDVERDLAQRTMRDNVEVAKLASDWFRRSIGRISRSNGVFLVISQVRDDPSGAGGMIMTGGNALKHYNSLTLQLSRKAKATWPNIPQGENKPPIYTGFKTGVRVMKTSVSADEGKSTTLQFIFGEGPDERDSLITAAARLGLIQKSGAWFTVFEGEPAEVKAQGRDNLVDLVAAREDTRSLLISEVNKQIKALHEG